QAKSRSCASGWTAVAAFRVRTSCRVTNAHTPAKRNSPAAVADDVSCAAIIWPSTPSAMPKIHSAPPPSPCTLTQASQLSPSSVGLPHRLISVLCTTL
ncbi:hypothetical protein LSTR_LSTR015853, partial [Laodelphax striatellus]